MVSPQSALSMSSPNSGTAQLPKTGVVVVIGLVVVLVIVLVMLALLSETETLVVVLVIEKLYRRMNRHLSSQ